MQKTPEFTAPQRFDDPDAALDQVRALLGTALSLGQDGAPACGHAAARRMLVLSLCDALLGSIGHGSATSALPASAASRRRIVARAGAVPAACRRTAPARNRGGHVAAGKGARS